MEIEEKVDVLKLMNYILSGLGDYLGNSGNWEANEELFNRLGNLTHDIQEKLEELTGEDHIKLHSPDA